MQKCANSVEFAKCCGMNIYSQISASTQPRTSLSKIGGDSIHLFNSLPTVWRRNGHRVRACRLLFLTCRRWLKLDVRPASQPAQRLALRNGLPLLLHSTHSSQCIFRAFQLSSRSSSTQTLIGWNLSTATTRRVHRCNTRDVKSSLD